ncbi:OmpA family protein [Paraburkholderia sp. BL21I4N1]|uniref:OmpA family protein n=1 Tax=Paraburkholderia sp. BL21I4N1 TaxID=1938801 RepID=UPI000CFD66F5|nr:OmpA family protein [Paraburkholderia sp. BL21I4N1]PQV50650.1 OmpA family protein [Paraburkholderia sp. BL21I4N1]
MKSIDLSQSVNDVFSASLWPGLSEKIGLPAELLMKVVAHTGPALIASLMASAVTPNGVAGLFSAVMSADSNARIGEQFAQQCSTMSGIKDLEVVGESLIARGTGRRIAVASDPISNQTGIPPQAAHVMTALVGAVLFGVLKHHVLLEEGTSSGLPALLGAQLPAVSKFLTHDTADSIGFDNAANFNASILGRLERVSTTLTQPSHAEEDVVRRTAPSSLHETVAPATGTRSSRRFVGLLFAVLSAVLIGVFTYGYFHAKPGVERITSLRESSEGVITPAMPAIPATASAALAVPAQPPIGSSSPQLPSAASATTPAGATTPASTPTAASAAQSASDPVSNLATRNGQLAFSVNQAGLPTLTATVSSDAERNVLAEALTRQFGAGRFAAELKVDLSSGQASWMSHIDELLRLMAVPRAEVAIEGTHIELSGAATNLALGWQRRLQSVFGQSWQIGQFKADQAVDQATVSFLSAMAKMLDAGGGCASADVIKVLNLQVVDFAESSGHIPSSARENLAETAQLLKACSDGGHPVPLNIEAFSDNAGDERANLALSQKRADSVRAFMMETGVKPDLLTARGYGAASPIASNATASGRFANRRIAFVLAQP